VPQKTAPCALARHTTYRSLRSVNPFLLSSHFYPVPPNPMLCNGPDTPLKVPLRVGLSAVPSNVWFLGFTRLSVPNNISIASAVFAQLTAAHPYTL